MAGSIFILWVFWITITMVALSDNTLNQCFFNIDKLLAPRRAHTNTSCVTNHFALGPVKLNIVDT